MSNYTTPSNLMKLSNSAKDILCCLLYFDIFHYPLSLEEIFQNCSSGILRINEVDAALRDLELAGFIKRNKRYYFLNGNEKDVFRRIAGSRRAARYMKIAKVMGRFLGHFPYVRGVFISGSLSKGYMEKGGDIDFFIITAPNRLWLSRTLIILFKKIFLLNSRKFLCPNYFIDTAHLEIPEKNIFTARELSFLIPVYNLGVYEQMMKSNEWTKAYLPNFNFDMKKISSGNSFVKTFAEKIFKGKLGEKLDQYFLQVTDEFWSRKYKKIEEKKLRIRCLRHVSKFHPKGYQNKVIDQYKESLETFELFHGINLQHG